MTLGFSVKFPDGQLTRFVEKIWSGIGKGEFSMKLGLYVPDFTKEYPSKIHTIRHDAKKRWKVGMTINCVLFNRTKNRYEFATLVCSAVQEIEIEWNAPYHEARVYIDKRRLSSEEVLDLVRNDGFDTLNQFHEFFDDDFYGRIIHWTDKRY